MAIKVAPREALHKDKIRDKVVVSDLIEIQKKSFEEFV